MKRICRNCFDFVSMKEKAEVLCLIKEHSDPLADLTAQLFSSLSSYSCK